MVLRCTGTLKHHAWVWTRCSRSDIHCSL